MTDESVEAREGSGLTDTEFDEFLTKSKATLLEHREGRIKPERDDKVLTAWNGLMLRGFAEAASILGRYDYAAVAAKNADFILANMRDGDRLLRTYKDGRAKLNAYLEDYAFSSTGSWPSMKQPSDLGGLIMPSSWAN